MYQRAVSGQYLFLSLVNLSGASQTGASGAISGRKLMGGDAMALLSGNIIETSGGTYRVNLYDWDISGNNVGFFFTASGCIPLMFNVVTIDATSGKVFPGSGVNTVVPPASVSGTTVIVPLATISGVNIASGQLVNVFSGQLSGQRVSPPLNMDLRVDSATATSGGAQEIRLSSGSVTKDNWFLGMRVFLYGYTGSGQVRTITSYGGSGNLATVDRPWDASGVPVSGTLYTILADNHPSVGSGQSVPLQSGQTVLIASGTQVVMASGSLSGQLVTLLSGYSYVITTATVSSGTLYLASGSLFRETFASGAIGASGGFPTAWGNSGQVFSASGAYVASGLFVNATASVASGSLYLASGSIFRETYASGVLGASGGHTLAWGNSGQAIVASGPNVTVPIATISGTNAVVPISTISGVVANSGLTVTVLPATISGVNTIADITRWLGVTPNALLSSGRVDAAFNIRTGAARSGTSTTIQLDAGAPLGTSGVYDYNFITLIAGSGLGQTRMIRFYSASGIATVSPAWEVAPDNNTVFTVHPAAPDASGITQPISGAFASVPIASISGTNAVVPITTISGVNAVVPIASISGTTVVVPLATISGVNIASGQSVNVFSGQLSGQPIAGLSGQIYTASGIFVTATASVASGSLYLASGSLFRETFASGVIGASGGFPTAWGNSGQVWSASGANVVVPIASISGTNAVVPIASISGVNAVVPKETLSGVVANSGLFVNATASVASGTLYLASGSIFRETYASGVLGASGGHTLAWGNSGQAWSASGAYAVVPKETLSGVVANSGLFVTATASVASGSLYLASGSIFRETYASGVLGASGGHTLAWGNSGQAIVASGPNVTVPIASISGTNVVVPIASVSGINAVVPKETLSGVVANSGLFVTATATVGSGQLYLASGSLFRETFASGVIGASGGFPTAWGNSGQVIAASGTTWIASGQTVLIASGTQVVMASGSLSGQFVTLLSGYSYTASGINVTATASVASGSLYLASGSIFRETFASGVVGASGGLPTAWGNSGMVVPVSGLVYAASGTTTAIASGTVYLASGTNVLVYSGQLSGQRMVADLWYVSGQIVSTFASGEMYIASGTSVLVYSGQLSGQPIAGLSGRIYPASGVFVTATASVASGSLYLASGSIFRETYASGVLGASGGHTLAWGNSGQAIIASGPNVTVPIASISGTNAVVPPATLSGVVANSGLFVTVPIATISGTNAVVPITTISGTSVVVPIASVSGINTVVPKETLSGVVANSGLFVTATATVGSGVLYLASGSLFRETFASGVMAASGGFPTAWGNSGTVTVGRNLDKSGYTAEVVSGTLYPASGTGGAVASGQIWLASGSQTLVNSGGLDLVLAESGVNFRQAMSILLAAEAGTVSGAGTGTIRIGAANSGGVVRITATVNASGNRTAVILNPPS